MRKISINQWAQYAIVVSSQDWSRLVIYNMILLYYKRQLLSVQNNLDETEIYDCSQVMKR